MNNTQKPLKAITAEDALTPILPGASCELGAEGHCITCSDEAQPATIQRIDLETGTALVTMQNITEEIDISLVDDVVPGSVVLVHGGVAIATIANEASNE